MVVVILTPEKCALSAKNQCASGAKVPPFRVPLMDESRGRELPQSHIVTHPRCDFVSQNSATLQVILPSFMGTRQENQFTIVACRARKSHLPS